MKLHGQWFVAIFRYFSSACVSLNNFLYIKVLSLSIIFCHISQTGGQTSSAPKSRASVSGLGAGAPRNPDPAESVTLRQCEPPPTRGTVSDPHVYQPRGQQRDPTDGGDSHHTGPSQVGGLRWWPFLLIPVI